MSGTLDDTICAIATPFGEGGIGIVRISGTKAIETAAALVRLRSGDSLGQVHSRVLYRADLLDAPPNVIAAPASASRPSRPIDEALVTVMRAPQSYTGEDVVELHCHGSPLVLQATCEALLRHGARVAEPGEFTKRAFLNGRLDLTQAEAVIDVINARTLASHRAALQQLEGALSCCLRALREQLLQVSG